jgi:WD40 repeat protein
MSLNKTLTLLPLFGSLLWFPIALQSEIAVPLESSARVFAIHRGSELLAIGSISGQVLLWDLRNKKPLRVFDRSKHGVDSLAFAPNGQQLVIASDDDVVYKYGRGFATIAVTPDIKSSGIKARVYGVQTGKEEAALKSSQTLNCARIDPSGRWLIAASYSNVEIWETKTWRHIATHDDFLPSGLNCLVFSPSDPFVAVAGRGGDILFLGLPDLKVLGKVQVAKRALSAMAFIHNGNKCVCGGLDGSLYVVDTTAKKGLSSITGFGTIDRIVGLDQNGLVAVVEDGLEVDPHPHRVVAVDLETKKKTVIYTAPIHNEIRVIELLDDSVTFVIGCSDTKGVVFVKRLE